MPDTSENQTDKKPGFVDAITGKVGKVGALIIALAALLSGVEKIFNVSSNFLGGQEEVAVVIKLKDCFEAELEHPDEVPFGGWPDMRLDLSGENKCGETLIGHVAFKAPGGTSLRIRAPFPPASGECQLAVPDCWDQIRFPEGKVDWNVSVPKLERLGSLLKPVPIDINWTVYADNKSIFSNKETITVLADETRAQNVPVP
jgi:hypothetical protein